MLLQTNTQPSVISTPLAATSTPTQVQSVKYLCQNDKTISAEFYTTKVAVQTATTTQPTLTGSVVLTFSDGRVARLPQTISADGARYAAPADTLVFWNKGNGVLVYENNVEADYRGCVMSKQSSALPAAYVDSEASFTMALPSLGTSSDTYSMQNTYTKQVANGKVSKGVAFTIPSQLATGTNLSKDSYIAVESLEVADCNASAFLDVTAASTLVTEQGTNYSIASSSDAGAGNRYNEIVYTLLGTTPCVAVRYFIHTTAYENYPAGSIKNFDTTALISIFDTIRRTLVINQ